MSHSENPDSLPLSREEVVALLLSLGIGTATPLSVETAVDNARRKVFYKAGLKSYRKLLRAKFAPTVQIQETPDSQCPQGHILGWLVKQAPANAAEELLKFVACNGPSALSKYPAAPTVLCERWNSADARFFIRLGRHLAEQPPDDDAIENPIDAALINYWIRVPAMRLVDGELRIFIRRSPQTPIGLQHCTARAVAEFLSIVVGRARTTFDIGNLGDVWLALVTKRIQTLKLPGLKPATVHGFVIRRDWVVPRYERNSPAGSR